jgi:hypothetical protein
MALTIDYRVLFKVIRIALLLFVSQTTHAQQAPNNYPRVAGYFSIVNPIATWNKYGFHTNFSDVYTVGFPMGINILKSDQFGISFEIAPFIRTENHISKVNSVLFHPGAMFRFGHGFTFIGRLAFETNGRYGFTPVLNQVIKRSKNSLLFISVPFTARFGNNTPASLGAAVQFGVGF